MKDSRERFIKRFLSAKTNTKLFQGFTSNEKKLYLLLLHENFYPILLQDTEVTVSFEKFSHLLRKKNTKTFHSFLTIKSVIFLFRFNRFYDPKGSSSSHRRLSEQKKEEKCLQKRNIFSIIVESITFLLFCSQQGAKHLFEKDLLRTKHTSISIHKPLASLEGFSFHYYSFRLEGSFSRSFHPEVLIRILRKRIQDVSFLHFIRKSLHSNFSLSEKKSFFPLIQIKNILWNLYVLELDQYFLTDCKYYSTSNECIYTCGNSSLSCFQKMNEWTSFVPKEKYKYLTESKLLSDQSLSTCPISKNREEKRNRPFLAKSITYKYLRTKTRWSLFLQKGNGTPCLLIKRLILQFLIRRFGYFFPKDTINSYCAPYSIDARNKDNSFFFSYFLQFTKKRNFVRINTQLFFFVNYFVRRVVSFLNPFSLIILILSKHKFCNSLGYPKSKSGWVTWTDADIIQHFHRIISSLFLFYSGCHNKKALCRIQYILHFSCVKTLACKHKTNLRQIYKKFALYPFGRNNLKKKDIDSSMSKETSLVSNQSKNHRLRHLFGKQRLSRVWNLHFTQIEAKAFSHLEDFDTLLKR